MRFNPGEIRAACVLAKKPLPSKPAKLNDVVRGVTMLGWFLVRKGRRKDNKKRLARIGQRYTAVCKLYPEHGGPATFFNKESPCNTVASETAT